jgi:hypothetical protein
MLFLYHILFQKCRLQQDGKKTGTRIMWFPSQNIKTHFPRENPSVLVVPQDTVTVEKKVEEIP